MCSGWSSVIESFTSRLQHELEEFTISSKIWRNDLNLYDNCSRNRCNHLDLPSQPVSPELFFWREWNWSRHFVGEKELLTVSCFEIPWLTTAAFFSDEYSSDSLFRCLSGQAVDPLSATTCMVGHVSQNPKIQSWILHFAVFFNHRDHEFCCSFHHVQSLPHTDCPEGDASE
jgi:hypothetical protein